MELLWVDLHTPWVAAAKLPAYVRHFLVENPHLDLLVTRHLRQQNTRERKLVYA